MSKLVECPDCSEQQLRVGTSRVGPSTIRLDCEGCGCGVVLIARDAGPRVVEAAALAWVQMFGGELEVIGDDD